MDGMSSVIEPGCCGGFARSGGLGLAGLSGAGALKLLRGRLHWHPKQFVGTQTLSRGRMYAGGVPLAKGRSACYARVWTVRSRWGAGEDTRLIAEVAAGARVVTWAFSQVAVLEALAM